MKEPNEALAPEAPPGTPEANASGPAKPEKSPLLREVRSLAVRLAVCQLCLPGEDPAPLVLDDALVTFDDRRMALALDALAELGRERQILLLRYGLGGQPPMTQLEAARILGISRSYISRLETHALDLLRQKWTEKPVQN